MLVEFRGEGDLQAALIRNISRGGLFIATPIEHPIGTKLDLLISIGDGDKIELPVIVASSGVLGHGSAPGIGCRFDRLEPSQQAIVDEMFATAIDAKG
jgi:Tfp pilus assembly protein PilZ